MKSPSTIKPTCQFWFLPLLAGGLSLLAPAASVAEQPLTPHAQGEANANTPLRVHRTTPVEFPISLLHSGITRGEAQVLVAIDPAGKVTDTLLAAYTREPFGDAALGAIRTWQYEAPRTNGEAVSAVVDIQVRFEVGNILVIERSGTPQFSQNDTSNRFAYQPYELRALDSIPTPLTVTQPIYPKEWIAQGMHGKVTVDFYIDESGGVRMPSVVTSEYPLLAAAASTAVRTWHFAAPRRKGRPVLAHCQQVFTFEVEQAKP